MPSKNIFPVKFLLLIGNNPWNFEKYCWPSCTRIGMQRCYRRRIHYSSIFEFHGRDFSINSSNFCTWLHLRFKRTCHHSICIFYIVHVGCSSSKLVNMLRVTGSEGAFKMYRVNFFVRKVVSAFRLYIRIFFFVVEMHGILYVKKVLTNIRVKW